MVRANFAATKYRKFTKAFEHSICGASTGSKDESRFAKHCVKAYGKVLDIICIFFAMAYRMSFHTARQSYLVSSPCCFALCLEPIKIGARQ